MESFDLFRWRCVRKCWKNNIYRIYGDHIQANLISTERYLYIIEIVPEVDCRSHECIRLSKQFPANCCLVSKSSTFLSNGWVNCLLRAGHIIDCAEGWQQPLPWQPTAVARDAPYESRYCWTDTTVKDFITALSTDRVFGGYTWNIWHFRGSGYVQCPFK